VADVVALQGLRVRGDVVTEQGHRLGFLGPRHPEVAVAAAGPPPQPAPDGAGALPLGWDRAAGAPEPEPGRDRADGADGADRAEEGWGALAPELDLGDEVDPAEAAEAAAAEAASAKPGADAGAKAGAADADAEAEAEAEADADAEEGGPRGLPRRLVISEDRRGRPEQGTTQLYFECNGVVVDTRTWRVLALPPPALCHRFPARAVNANLAAGLYDAVPVLDGTVLTLYRWKDHWALASSNAYDISRLRRTGPLTFAEAFADVVTRLCPAFVAATGFHLRADGRVGFERLPEDRCYTVGFRHHLLHPLRSDPERVWQVQTTFLREGPPRTVLPQAGADPAWEAAGLPGVPWQAVLAPEALLGGGASVGALRARGGGALARALGGRPPDYGVILRSRDLARTRGASDLLLGTDLLDRVRWLAYTDPPARKPGDLCPDTRAERCALRAFLTATDRGEFLALFPQWAARFQAFQDLTDAIVKQVIHAARQEAMAPASEAPPLKSPLSKVARALLAHFQSQEKLTAFHQKTESIVRDHVLNPEYEPIFFRLLAQKAAGGAPPAKAADDGPGAGAAKAPGGAEAAEAAEAAKAPGGAEAAEAAEAAKAPEAPGAPEASKGAGAAAAAAE
jgi:hypothetical protein